MDKHKDQDLKLNINNGNCVDDKGHYVLGPDNEMYRADRPRVTVYVENQRLKLMGAMLYSLCGACCNIVCGLIAIGYSLSAMGDVDAGKMDSARKKTRRAIVLTSVGIAISIPIIIVVMVIVGKEMNNALALVNDANDLFAVVKKTRILDILNSALDKHD